MFMNDKLVPYAMKPEHYYNIKLIYVQDKYTFIWFNNKYPWNV